MEHTATSTLIREQEVESLVDPLHERPEIPLPLDVRATDRPDERSLVRRLVSEGGVVFLLSLGLYLTVAVLLDFKYHAFTGDAFSRMANGFYILYSRDRHLAAVGFVWTPLQSLADLVFLLGNHLWPALSRNNMAGSLVSALAMAGTVYQLRSALREWGLSRIPRLVLTACFALNPMIVFYGGNGMSEGLFLFTLVTSTRYLLRWMRGGDLRSLAYAGVALAFSYLTRNEAAGAALSGAVVVGAVSYWRSRGAATVTNPNGHIGFRHLRRPGLRGRGGLGHHELSSSPDTSSNNSRPFMATRRRRSSCTTRTSTAECSSRSTPSERSGRCCCRS